MKNKKDLIRVVRNEQGEYSLDTTGKKPGRGAYVCKSSHVLKRLVKIRALKGLLSLLFLKIYMRS